MKFKIISFNKILIYFFYNIQNIIIYETALDYAKQHNYQKIVDLLTKPIKQDREEKLLNQQKAFEEKMESQQIEFKEKLGSQQKAFENQKNEFENQMNQMKLILEQNKKQLAEFAKQKEDLTATANNENNKK